MKKLIAVCILGLSAASVWAQGQVNFLNGGATFATAANRYVYFGAVGPGAVNPSFPNFLGSADPNRVTGTTYVAGLWYLAGANRGAEIGTAAQAGRTFAFRPASTLEQNRGTWVVPTGINSLFDMGGVNFGTAATLQVRVWDGAKFATFDAALAAGQAGRSDPFNYTAPLQGELNPNAYLMDNLRAFAVTVPEPSTIALGLLGVAGLLAFRRRK